MPRDLTATMVIAFVSLLPISLTAQQVVTSDAQAKEIMERARAAAGITQAALAAPGLSGSGTISFNWKTPPETGPVTLSTRGAGDFRMSADLSDGAHSWVVTNGVGQSRKPKGKAQDMPQESSMDLSNLLLPYRQLWTELQDPYTTFSYADVESKNERQVYRIHVCPSLRGNSASLPASRSKDLLVDALTFRLTSVEDYPFRGARGVAGCYSKTSTAVGEKLGDSRNPSNSLSLARPREIQFSDYRMLSGIAVPLEISTKLAGQITMTIKLPDHNLKERRLCTNVHGFGFTISVLSAASSLFQ